MTDVKRDVTTLRAVRDAIAATGGDERLHRQVSYAEEEVNRLAFGYAQAVIAGAVTGRYAPENLLGLCSALLDPIGMDSGTEAALAYCNAMVRHHVDQLKGE